MLNGMVYCQMLKGKEYDQILKGMDYGQTSNGALPRRCDSRPPKPQTPRGTGPALGRTRVGPDPRWALHPKLSSAPVRLADPWALNPVFY
jgi:hypothetical protein